MNWIPIQTGWSNGYLETIDPQKIVQYQECQPRVNGTDPEVVTEYALDMREYDEALKEKGIPGWKKFPHLYCVKTDNNQHILVSGFHRLDAILKVGYEKIDVYCIDGTLQDAIVLSKGENANNGVRRTNSDIKYVVQACLLDDELKQWSNPQIAKWCGVSAQTVNNHEKSLAKFASENEEDYLRPTRRKRLSKHGEIEWIETAKIGNGEGKQAKSASQIIEEEQEIEKETVLEHLYQNRQDFQTAVSDFAQSRSYLDFAYCRRRIKSLVGLEDATDEGATDYTQWNLQEIRTQSQIADESVRVIKGYLDEDPKIEGHPIATLLSEMQRIHEIHQSAKLDTYTRPFLHQPLSDALERIEKLWTADWEAKSDEERLDDLNELEAELPSLIEAEDTAQADEKTASEVSKKLLKQKKQKAKLLWDTRIQAARDYTGDADTELNLYLTLPDLEKGFAKSNPAYADAFQSAMKRTSEQSFNIVLEKVLESDIDVETLETEHRALMTYAGDLRNWQRSDWSPDTNWILPLIAAKKAKAETSSDGVSVAPDGEVEDTVDSLWEQITPAIAAWKSERKGQGVGYASKTMFIAATKRFHDLPQETETDVDLLQKLLALLTEVQGRMYTFERYIKMQCDGASIWKTDETEAAETEQQTYEQKQREHVNRLESLPGQIRSYLPTWQEAHGIEVTLTLNLLLNARNYSEFGKERSRGPVYREEMEDLLQRMKSNDKDFVEKVRELLRGVEPAQEQGDWEILQHEHPLTVIDKLKDGLKRETHVVDIEAFVEDILHFYHGIGVSELLTSSAETLKNISDFIEGFVDQPFAEWPEYIRNHRSVPERELVLVAIGINNHTDDEFEVVEFTDESSDEIWCELNALPEDLRTALFKIAAEKVYEEAVEEFHTDA